MVVCGQTGAVQGPPPGSRATEELAASHVPEGPRAALVCVLPSSSTPGPSERGAHASAGALSQDTHGKSRPSALATPGTSPWPAPAWHVGCQRHHVGFSGRTGEGPSFKPRPDAFVF